MISSVVATFRHGIVVGLRAGRENLLPGLVIQGMMLLLVVGYFRHWPSTALLDLLASLKARWGHLFTFVASGLFAGVLAEGFRVVFLQRGRATRENFKEMLFRFVLMGFGGVGADYNYLFLGHLLGTDATPRVIAEKVAFDQFVYSAFLPCPIMALAYHWKEAGYRLAALGDLFSLAFVGGRIVPLTLSNFCFWIPATALIYSLPLPLQLPLFLLAVTIWGLLLVSISTRRQRDGKIPPLPVEETILPV